MSPCLLRRSIGGGFLKSRGNRTRRAKIAAWRAKRGNSERSCEPGGPSVYLLTRRASEGSACAPWHSSRFPRLRVGLVYLAAGHAKIDPRRPAPNACGRGGFRAIRTVAG